VADALMITSSFLPGRGGIESYLAELCDELAPRLAVLAAGRREGSELPANLAYPTVAFPGRLLVPGPRARRATIEAARRLEVDRVLFGTPWPLVLMAPRLEAAGLSYGVIVHGAELLVPAAVPGLQRRLARALHRADLVLAVSHFTSTKVSGLLAKRGFVDRVPILRARVDADRFRPGLDGSGIRARHGIPETHKLILCFGRLVKRKGVDRLLDALPRIRSQAGDVTLLVAGTGPELKRLQRHAGRRDLPVAFAGRVADEDAPLYYAAADLFALPVVDRYAGLEIEGLGVVLLEASASGLPCVTGRSGGTPEAVLEGETGLVVDASEPAALADACGRLLNDRELSSRMGAAGRAYVTSEFAPGHFPDELLQWLGRGRSI
jgi:phosphatidyl-myo-inositol dimannoside synthase